MPARRNPGARVVRSVVSGEDPYPILVDLDAEGMRDLLGAPLVAETRIALLHVDDGRDELRGRTLGPGLQRWFRCIYGLRTQPTDSRPVNRFLCALLRSHRCDEPCRFLAHLGQSRRQSRVPRVPLRGGEHPSLDEVPEYLDTPRLHDSLRAAQPYCSASTATIAPPHSSR